MHRDGTSAPDDSHGPVGETGRLFAEGRPLPERDVELALAHAESLLFGREPTPLTIGRYVLLRSLGSGGFGAVYECYDPQLDRKVAIKLVRLRSTTADDALLHEARAASRLSHPNVVTVHDVGRYNTLGSGAATDAIPAHGLFMVMELADGTELGQWLREHEPRWPAIVDVFVRAGHGLAAAHAGGIVHLDFKPKNVIVDAAGNPKVADFGLARTIEGAPSEGGPIGTAPYMAPEQHLDAPNTGPAADQYAFCVALFEALAGAHPFDAATFDELYQRKLAGPPRAEVRGVPERVLRIVRRGLAPHPNDRHGSMRELVDALARARRRRGPVVLAGLGLVGLAALVIARSGATAPCEELAAERDASWGASQRDAVHSALTRREPPFAAVVAETTVRELDGWSRAWLEVRRDECLAAVDRGAPDPARSSVCLAAARARFDALVERLAVADDTVVLDAFNLIDALPSTAPCRGADDHGRGTTAIDEVIAIERQLAAGLAARGEAGLALVDAAILRAEASDDSMLALKARMVRAELLGDDERVDDAVAAYHEIALAAERSGDDRTAVEALVHHAYLQGVARRRTDDAFAAIDLAAAKCERAELDWLSHARVLRVRGQVLDAAHRYPEAIAELERAHALYREHLGAEHPSLANIEASLARATFNHGDLARAEAHTRQGLAITERRIGPEHPIVLSIRADLATFAKIRGEHEQALAELQAIVPALERALGPRHRLVATVLQQLGATQLAAGQAEPTITTLERVVELRTATLPEHDDELLRARAMLLDARIAAGHWDDARRELGALEDLFARVVVRDRDLPFYVAALGIRLAHASGATREARDRVARLPTPSAELGAWSRVVGIAEAALVECDVGDREGGRTRLAAVTQADLAELQPRERAMFERTRARCDPRDASRGE